MQSRDYVSRSFRKCSRPCGGFFFSGCPGLLRRLPLAIATKRTVVQPMEIERMVSGE
jgi:hypothetical protein